MPNSSQEKDKTCTTMMPTRAKAATGVNELHEQNAAAQESNNKEAKPRAAHALPRDQGENAKETHAHKAIECDTELDPERMQTAATSPQPSPRPGSMDFVHDSALPGHIQCLSPHEIRSLLLLWKALFELEASHVSAGSARAKLHSERHAFDLQYEPHEEKKNRRSRFWPSWRKSRHGCHNSPSSSVVNLSEAKAGKANPRARLSKVDIAFSGHVFRSLQFGVASLPLRLSQKGAKKEAYGIPRTSFSEELWRGFLFRADVDVDSTLLRFLRARDWDLTRATPMLTHAMEWRARNAIFDILRQGEAVVAYSIWSSSKFYFYKTDRSGRPVIYLEIRKHFPKNQTNLESQLCMVYNMEISRRFFHATAPQSSSSSSLALPLPLSSSSSSSLSLLTNVSNVMETVTLVFNMTSFTLSNMDTPAVKFLIHCLQNYYPETLGRCYIVAAPALFWIVWKMIRPWLDPVVAAKVFFIKLEDLGQYIDDKNMLQAYGGENDFEFVYDVAESELALQAERQTSAPSLSESKTRENSSKASLRSSHHLHSRSDVATETSLGRVSLEESGIVASDVPELMRLQQEFYAARSEFIQLTCKMAEAVEPITETQALKSTFQALNTVLERRKELKTQLYTLSLALDDLTVPTSYYDRHGFIARQL